MKIRVAQCWDDGVATDVRLTEILRKHHAKATFNLCPGNLSDERISPYWLDPYKKEWSYNGFRGGAVGRNELRKVYDGFEVASHCWCHENAGTIPDADFLSAALRARTFLEDLFQKDCRGFAWPCGRYTPETVKLMREAGFAYGRTTDNSPDVLPCEEPMILKSSCHYMSCNFWNIFEEAKKTSHVFYFWGHSYEMYEYDKLWERTEGRIAGLSADPDVEWVNVVDLFR